MAGEGVQRKIMDDDGMKRWQSSRAKYLELRCGAVACVHSKTGSLGAGLGLHNAGASTYLLT